MLKLKRRKGESLVIGGVVTVTVIAINGGRVDLGIEGPDGVSIHRLEVCDRIKAEHAASLDVERVAVEVMRI